MEKELKPSNKPSIRVRPLIEPQNCTVMWTDDSYRRRNATSELFSREYRQVLDELFSEHAYPRSEGPPTANFHYRIQLRNGAIRDHGAFIRGEEGNAEEVAATIKLMKAKGWKSFVVNGALEFRCAMFQAAVLDGFPPDKVLGYTPTRNELEALRATKPRAFRKPEPEQVLALVERHSDSMKG